VGVLDSFRFVPISIAGWMNHEQQQAIDCSFHSVGVDIREVRLRHTQSPSALNALRSAEGSSRSYQTRTAVSFVINVFEFSDITRWQEVSKVMIKF
jgi:hypothetical protein